MVMMVSRAMKLVYVKSDWGCGALDCFGGRGGFSSELRDQLRMRGALVTRMLTTLNKRALSRSSRE